MASTIAEAVEFCSASFSGLYQALESATSDSQCQVSLTSVADQHGRFNVWAGNIGAHQTGQSSLDYRLRDASQMKEEVTKVLGYLSETLRDTAAIINGNSLVYEVSSSDSDSEPESYQKDQKNDDSKDTAGTYPAPVNIPLEGELRQLSQSASDIIANLYKLSIIIRSGNLSQDRFLKSSKTDVSCYEPFDEQHAKNKFPQASKKLVERLGKANTRRRQYLKYRERHHEKLSVPRRNSVVSIQPVTQRFNAPGIEIQAKSGAQLEQKHQERDPSSVVPTGHEASTVASTFIALNAPEMVQTDVDIYSEIGTVSSYESSPTEIEKPQLPPPPQTSEGGRDFECPYCYTICRLAGRGERERKSEWKRHVFRDIQPYICTHSDCSKAGAMFERRRDWFQHETQIHRKEWCCNAAGHDPFTDKLELVKHMESNHQEIAEPVQLARILELFERPMEKSQASCPLCPAKESRFFPARRLERHLAQHMEAFALFALPRSNTSCRQGSINSAKSNVGIRVSEESCYRLNSPSARENCAESGVTTEHTESPGNEARLQEGSDFDTLIRDFCTVGECGNTVVPTAYLRRLETAAGAKHSMRMVCAAIEELVNASVSSNTERLSSSSIHRDRDFSQGPVPEIKVTDVLMKVFAMIRSERYRYDPISETFHTLEDKKILSFITLMADSVNTLDFREDQDDPQVLESRLRMLISDLGVVSTITSGPEEELGYSSWDFVLRGVRISYTALHILSENLSAVKSIGGLVVRDAVLILTPLSNTLPGMTYERYEANHIEAAIRSCEEDMFELKSFAKSIKHKMSLPYSYLNKPLDHLCGRLKEAFPQNFAEIHQHIYHKSQVRQYHPGTLEWFFNSPKYTKWAETGPSLLWLTGAFASGKTVLCSAVIEQLRNDCSNSNTTAVAFYYCHKDDSEESILWALIAQLLRQSKPVPDSLQYAYPQGAKPESSNANTSRQALWDALGMYEKAYIVIDGLDYRLARSGMFQVFSFSYKSTRPMTGTLHLMLTCRVPYTMSCFSAPVNGYYETISEERVRSSADVLVVEYMRSLSPSMSNGKLGERMRSFLLTNTRGMLLWTSRHLERLKICTTNFERESLLYDSPATMAPIWSDGLARVSKGGHEAKVLVKILLEVLTISVRALSMEEIETISRYYLGWKRISPDIFHYDRIFTIASSLVAFSFPEQILKLVHPGLREFLLAPPDESDEAQFYRVRETIANHDLATCCLLTLIDGHSGRVPFKSNSFLEYSAKYWHIRFKRSGIGGPLNLVIELFTPPTYFTLWLAIYDPDGHPAEAGIKKGYASPLYYASLLGLDSVAEALLDRGARLDERGGKHGGPFMAALSSGHEHVMKVFVDASVVYVGHLD